MPKRRHPPRPKGPTPEVGAVRNGYVYLPDHPLAVRGGWVAEHRAAAFASRNGIAECDAGKSQMEWRNAKVVNVGEGDWLVLCQSHAALRWFAAHVAATRFGGSEGERLAVDMGALWKAPCPAAEGSSGTEDRQDFMDTPIGVIHGGPAAPETQEVVLT